MAEPTAHSEAPAEHGGFPPFQSQHFPSQLFWLALTFILLYVLMSRIALPRIGAIFAEQRRRLATPSGKLLFANSDLSGFSIFEEAQYRGVQAAGQALRKIG